ncbi:MAG: 50S ribosomal protein L4 [Bdellovibrio sp. CG12_big_fil_rev_8_21_14_0_65_39_13]|nr:MAG: 50S ribosomal protein L4 [Bdellovibrio sp. CG22_combo_CG10-13_8_21_14_all_39_27]PIQ59209.1 MAG: 50S ribosomal protein L4 [Bdellovibrio sp. CG12_big_fil_rev_8_21_14_0_65_39_13]PIR37010.1 MAG: 50S ribosomal protein L4 [Bdellovibrio sp. CG11_big_fil_rev_8_21_14_0_20_39_38]
MAEINVLNKKFESSGKLNTEVDLSADVINVPVVHQVVKALLASRRQGNACTKTKGFVSGGGMKPYKQKGTGRARQGSSRSPLFVGGGTAFGPQPRSYEQKVNKKVANLAIQSVIADKLQAGKLTVVETVESTGKTKDIFKTLNSKSLLPALVVTASDDSAALKAVRNIKNAKATPVSGFSVYEAVKFENLVIEKEALEKLLQRLV